MGFCFIIVVLFVFCKIRTKLRSVTLKKQKVYVAVSQTHRFLFPPHVHHGRTGSENNGVGLAEPAMTLDGCNTHTLEMETVSVTESVLFPLKQEMWGKSGMKR